MSRRNNYEASDMSPDEGNVDLTETMDRGPIDAFPEAKGRIKHKKRNGDQLEKEDILEGKRTSVTWDVGERLTEQHHKDDVDLNVMMARMGVTNRERIPEVPISPEINDFTEVVDLREAMDRMNTAKEQFAGLPAKLRARFNNNPANMYTFLQDRENYAEAVKIGLLQQAPMPEPEKEKTPPQDKPADK